MIEPFHYGFFVKGIIATTLVGGLCGLVGVYIVLRGMAYIGHGLSHAIFGGAVVTYVMSANFLLGATIWGFISAMLITLITRKRQIKADAAIGIVTTAAFAVGIAIVSRYRTFTRDLDAALFGNILGVSSSDLVAIVVVAIIASIVLFVGYKLFLFATFDQEVSSFYGVPTHLVNAMFSLVLAATIVVSMRVVGVTLIAAAILIPTVIARLFTNSFKTLVLLSTFLGSLCGFLGIYVSWYLDISSGASVVLFSSGLFVLAIIYTGIRDKYIAIRSRKQTVIPDKRI